MTIYIQKHGDGYVFDGCYAAYEGAAHRAWKIIHFEDIREVPARRDILLVACVEDTQIFFDRLGIKRPIAINIPEFIMPYIKRDIKYMTLDAFFEMPICPTFVKPAIEIKIGASGVIEKDSSKRFVLSDIKDGGTLMMTSSVVDMQSEYRVYCRKGHGIVGMKHYQGDEMLYPDNQYIREVCHKLISDKSMPQSFSADFAVIGPVNGEKYTELIECQDAWSIGAYGLDGNVYLSFLLDRWQQLMKL
jgi:hypothetical protein